jgi:hypothetical protein
MFTNRMKMALFTTVIASSVIIVSGLVTSAFADMKKETSQDPLPSYLSFPITVGVQSENRGDDSSDDGPPPAVLSKDESSSPTSHSANSEDSEWTTADNNTIPEKYMKGLSNCESTAAADGDLTLVELMDCFYQVF